MGMATKNRVSWLLFCVASITFVYAQEDSLRSAVNAIDRRQRDLTDYEETEYGYPLERPEDLVFLKTAANYNPERTFETVDIIGQPIINYLDEDRYDSNLMSKRISSAFRERVEEDNQKQLEELAHNLISNVESKPRYESDNEDNYEELLKEFWEKYRRPYEEAKIYSNIEKRFYYPQFGMDAVGLRKRNRYYKTDLENMNAHQHLPRRVGFEDDDDDENLQLNYLRKKYYQRENKLNRIRQMYSNPYSQIKRFPVTKRSSDYMAKEDTQKQKKSVVKKQTDPKVVKDLGNIFGTNEDTVVSTSKPETTTYVGTINDKKLEDVPKTNHSKNDKGNKPISNKKLFSPVVAASQKPLLIKKKSIDWSDYFGLDRRKKSEPNDLDKEWLIERYHKSLTMSSKKRNAEVPLSSFLNHDESSKKEFLEDVDEEKDKFSPEEQKIDDMDTKLKVMEDRIVDDALKYTGAHEGESDPKEVQEVKDKVISRLAAAYSLEKMRNALGEYKLAVAKERERLKNRPKEDDYMFSEEKRTSVPRKQVIDKDGENVPEADNNIKCADGNEDCHEQSYRTPSEILENHFGIAECPAIQRACNDIASAVGQYGHVFQSACRMHEMCLLCSNNSWFSPTRQCNTLFLAKAYDICKGSMECRREAQRSVRYLVDVNRSLHSQLSATDDCELSCPETEVMVNASDTR